MKIKFSSNSLTIHLQKLFLFVISSTFVRNFLVILSRTSSSIFSFLKFTCWCSCWTRFINERENRFFFWYIDIFLIHYNDIWLQIRVFQHDFSHVCWQRTIIKYTLKSFIALYIIAMNQKIVKILIFDTKNNFFIYRVDNSIVHFQFALYIYKTDFVYNVACDDCTSQSIWDFRLLWMHDDELNNDERGELFTPLFGWEAGNNR